MITREKLLTITLEKLLMITREKPLMITREKLLMITREKVPRDRSYATLDSSPNCSLRTTAFVLR